MSLKFILFPLLALALIGCSQTIAPQATADKTPSDFFWTSAELNSGVNYNMTGNGTSSVHPIFSRDGVHVLDGSINKTAFRILSLGDTISIDSLGANSIFSLPQGYYFASDLHVLGTHDSVVSIPYDTTFKVERDSNVFFDSTLHLTRDSLVLVTSDSLVQIGSGLELLERSHLDSNASWQAGTLVGPGLGSGVPITARVVDHVTALSVDSISTHSESYGESYVVRYAYEAASGAMDASFPLFWKVYYARGVGPVLIEEYMNSANTYTLQSRAILQNK